MADIETRYARSGDVNVAYQIVGSGPIDLVFVMGWVSNIDQFWTEPSFARFLHRLASFSRLIVFDKRGTGLSDRVPVDRLPSLEERMDDVRAVMDAAGSRRASLVGVSEGGPLCLLFAATYPERTSAVVVVGGYARRLSAPDHPFGDAPEDFDRVLARIPREWGGSFGLAVRAPSAMGDERFVRWWGGYLRSSASPAAAVALTRMIGETDVRHVLPAVRVPVLVIHRRGDRAVPVEVGRSLAERIPSARFVELPGDDHLPFVGDQDAILAEIQDFLTGVRPPTESDRFLASVLFTDIVEGTRKAAELGDRRWRALVEDHHELVRRELARFRGREIDTAGDGFFASFDGPGRAIRCASAIRDGVRALGVEIRAGVHTGECEEIAGKVGGIAVIIAARVKEQAGPSEVVASSTVKDLVAGSGIEFEDIGTRALKGVPGEWRLYRVANA